MKKPLSLLRSAFSAFAFLAFAFASVAAFAQTDPKAKEVLNKMSAKYKAYTSMQFGFTSTLENKAENITQTRKGSAYVRGTNFHVNMGDQVMFSNGTAVYTYLKDANEVTISDMDGASEINPATMFTAYQKGFKISFAQDAAAAQLGNIVIDLTPEDARKPVFKVRLTVKKATNELVSAKIFEKSGTRYTFNVNTFVPNKPVADSYFKFDKGKYPGAEVTDLR